MDNTLEYHKSFGQFDDDGTIYVALPDRSKVVVGKYTIGSPEEGVEYFAKKFQNLATEIVLCKKRCLDGKAKASALVELTEKIKTVIAKPSVVGDYTVLISELPHMEALAEKVREEQKLTKLEAKKKAVVRKKEIIERVEKIKTSNSWKKTSEEFESLLEEWKKLPRAGTKVEKELWEQFSNARNTFSKRRKEHFADLKVISQEVENAKAKLIKRAMLLSTSTDWEKTPKQFAELLKDWKSLPRGKRAKDNQQWEEFNGYQTHFFSKKKEVEKEKEKELEKNIPAKEALLEKIEAINVKGNIDAADKALRQLLEKWDKCLAIPAAVEKKFENRLHKIENAVRKAKAELEKKNDPDKQARALSTISLFEQSIANLKKQLTNETGNEAEKIKEKIEHYNTLLEAAKDSLDSLTVKS